MRQPRIRVPLECEHCHQVVMVPPLRIRNKARFCSPRCHIDSIHAAAEKRASVIHFCECGCGQRTNPVKVSARGLLCGEHPRYLVGHNQRVKRDLGDRFWSKVDKSGACWNWTAQIGNHGYGKFYLGFSDAKRAWTAHRYSYTLAFGPIPDGLFVCHHCDNRRCVNPAHLFIGTAMDNSQDAKRKGRLVRGPRKTTT